MREQTFEARTLDLGWSTEEIESMIKEGFTAIRTGFVIRVWRCEDDARAHTVRMSSSALTARLWTAEFNKRVRKEQRS